MWPCKVDLVDDWFMWTGLSLWLIRLVNHFVLKTRTGAESLVLESRIWGCKTIYGAGFLSQQLFLWLIPYRHDCSPISFFFFFFKVSYYCFNCSFERVSVGMTPCVFLCSRRNTQHVKTVSCLHVFLECGEHKKTIYASYVAMLRKWCVTSMVGCVLIGMCKNHSITCFHWLGSWTLQIYLNYLMDRC